MLGKREFLIASGAGSAGVALSASGVESAAGAERPKDAAQDGDRAAVKLAHDHHTRAVRAIRKGQGDARYLLKKGTKPAVVRERQRHHDDIATKHLLQAIALRPGWIHLYHQLVRVYGRHKMHGKIRPLLVKGRAAAGENRWRFDMSIRRVDRLARR